MREVLVSKLKGEEELAVPVIANNGSVLIHADTILKQEYIERMQDYGIDIVFVKDVEEVTYSVDESYAESKVILEKVLKRHIYKHNEELKKIGEEAEKIVDNVLSEPEVIGRLTEVRNISTDMYSHCINVCSLSTIMALKLKMSERQVRNVAMGAIMHDVGLQYISVPYINVEPAEMSPQELSEYKKHTVYGYSSMQEEEWLSDVSKEIILLHHERIDGEGYPFQQRGAKLKPEVKLVTLCDDFDSLISGIGNKKVKMYEAIEYIRDNVGRIYDSTISGKFLESIAVYPVGMEVVLNDGEVGMVVTQNKEITDRPVIKMLRHADGSEYKEEVIRDLMKCLTTFIVDTL
ncbi:MAG: HD domain-containing protein [Lachnospiraceae bacterium]|nr:HD domain-containing protein [Lachnospiraceae bacterium]MBQ4282459.1 HD domain-containing protein [Lachnospira sp.]